MAPSIVFLANDDVYDLVIAFLNSVRVTHGNVPLHCIPFDDRIAKLQRLADVYKFKIFTDHRALKRCDDISREFHGAPKGHYRKLVAWEGISEEFIYVDVDTIVLDDLRCASSFLDKFDFVLSKSRLQSTFRWVWKPSIMRSRLLSEDQIKYAANTGFICSRQGALSLDEAEAKLSLGLSLAADMELLCCEQAFLNYLIVTSGRRHTSLSELRRLHGFKALPTEVWAGTPGGIVQSGRVMFPGRTRVLFVHWAGRWREKPPSEASGDDPSNAMQMPYDELWRFYRHLNMRDESMRVPQHSPKAS